MADAVLFESHRPLLFSIAYRMLGTASDAEDVVQDAWLRWSGVDPASIREPRAFAATIVTRLCLDRMKSARATRESYVGPWLPEPVLTAGEETPDVLAQRAESVTLAFLVLLETLTAEERAVFLLKELFEYDHSEIAEMLGTTSANSRQLLHRAKEKVAARPEPSPAAAPGAAVPREEQRRVAERFASAFYTGDAAALTELLAADVRFVADGGGKVPSVRRPLQGRDAVLTFLIGVHRAGRRTGVGRDVAMRAVEVNAEPALAVRIAGRLDSVYVFGVDAGGRVHDIRVVRNPDKLAYIDRQLARVM